MSLIPLVQDAIQKRHLPSDQEARIANEMEYRQIDDIEFAALSLLGALVSNGMISLDPRQRRTDRAFASCDYGKAAYSLCPAISEK